MAEVFSATGAAPGGDLRGDRLLRDLLPLDGLRARLRAWDAELRPRAFLGVQLGAMLFMAAGIIAAGIGSDAHQPARVLMRLRRDRRGRPGDGPVMGGGLAGWSGLAVGGAGDDGLRLRAAGAFLPSLFPPRVRYTGASMAFNVGGILGGGLAPFVAQALAAKGGLTPVGRLLARRGPAQPGGLATLRRVYED
jgi:hypothetical protein